MKPKFIIQKSKDGQFYFNLVATNSEIVATSEMYRTKQSCYSGIIAVRSAAAVAEIVEKSNFKTQKHGEK